MKLNKIQKEKLLQHFNKKVPKLPECSVCHKKIWTISDTIYELREYHGGSVVLGSPLAPIITLICKNCGNTLFFNAILLNIIQHKNKDSKNE